MKWLFQAVWGHLSLTALLVLVEPYLNVELTHTENACMTRNR